MERERERETETERDRERQRQTDRQTDRETETKRHRERQREEEKKGGKNSALGTPCPLTCGLVDPELLDGDLRDPVPCGGEGHVAGQPCEHGALHLAKDQLAKLPVVVREPLQLIHRLPCVATCIQSHSQSPSLIHQVPV